MILRSIEFGEGEGEADFHFTTISTYGLYPSDLTILGPERHDSFEVAEGLGEYCVPEGQLPGVYAQDVSEPLVAKPDLASWSIH